MSRFVVLLNAPPGAGKDTAARYMRNKFEQRGVTAAILKFAAPLKHAVHEMFGFHDVSVDYFEQVKDVPNELFGGKTPRQAYIDFSEDWVKPTYGHDFWAKAGSTSALQSKAEVVIFSDCGFQPEVDTLVKKFGIDHVYLFHITRPTKNFEELDSRNWVTLTDCTPVIANDGTLTELEDEMTMAALQMMDIWKLRK